MALGFGIIGCGMIANFHAKAIEDVRGAKLVACFDTVAASADRLAASTGARAYHDLDRMLADPEVDVVVLHDLAVFLVPTAVQLGVRAQPEAHRLGDDREDADAVLISYTSRLEKQVL